MTKFNYLLNELYAVQVDELKRLSPEMFYVIID